MDISIQQIGNGASFSVEFKKLVVQKCTYLGSIVNQKVENMDFMSGVTATIGRFLPEGPINISLYDKDFGIFLPSITFQVSNLFYSNSEGVESVQAAYHLIKGARPVGFAEVEFGKVTLFFFSKQKGQFLASIVLNPDGVDDHYYRIIFYEN